MIHDTPTRIAQSTIMAHPTLKELEMSTVHFYLTGSRFAGLERAESDWDFFANADAGPWLTEHGFEKVTDGDYEAPADGTAHPYNIQVWECGNPDAEHGVDTTDTFDLGVASLEAHRAYIDGLGWEGWDAREFLEGFGRQTGTRMGVRFAMAAKVYPMGWGD